MSSKAACFENHRELCRNSELCWNGNMTDGERIQRLEDRVDKLAEATNEFVRESTRIFKEVAIRFEQTDARFDQLTVRLDETDKRWNQLIDLLAKEHGNGKKRPN